MILLVLAYLGGVLTILSPCILPVLPFVFARSDQRFVRSGLPLLGGMAVAFVAVASVAAIGGGWIVQTNQYGRMAAMVLLALFGITLLFPSIADHLSRPLVAMGARMSGAPSGDRPPSIVASVVLGLATGLLWAPCAGPILGLILTGAALQGASIQTSLLLLAYAAGAATSLALALAIGGKVFRMMKRSLGVGEWVRRGLGVAVLGAVVIIALGLDTGILTRISLASTGTLEQGLLERLHPGSKGLGDGQQTAGLMDEGPAPPLDGAVQWLNSPPLTTADLKGKVVIVDFWTYSCINCLRAIPYVRAWAEKYRDQGLVVVGVHTPEFAFEHDVANVRKAVTDLKISYPVAIDNDYAIWQAFENRYWPAHYFIDANGHLRHTHFGEGGYDQSERIIQQLLAEAGRSQVATGLVSVTTSGAEAASDVADVKSPETYLGYERAENFASTDSSVHDAPHPYAVAETKLNQWGLAGDWTIRAEQAILNEKDGAIVYRFHARDLHLVLRPDSDGHPVRFVVTIDGKPPGNDHGSDVDATGTGVVTEQRLYQLVRQSGPISDRTFEIRFLDPGVQAYAFTFG